MWTLEMSDTIFIPILGVDSEKSIEEPFRENSFDEPLSKDESQDLFYEKHILSPVWQPILELIFKGKLTDPFFQTSTLNSMYNKNMGVMRDKKWINAVSQWNSKVAIDRLS